MESGGLLDEPIRRRGRLNPDLDWFWAQLPARAQALILKTSYGGMLSRSRGEPLPPIQTLRDFIKLPAGWLLAQRNCGRKTYSDLCRALRAGGVTESLFSDC